MKSETALMSNGLRTIELTTRPSSRSSERASSWPAVTTMTAGRGVVISLSCSTTS
jgi:hypothetical protein